MTQNPYDPPKVPAEKPTAPKSDQDGWTWQWSLLLFIIGGILAILALALFIPAVPSYR